MPELTDRQRELELAIAETQRVSIDLVEHLRARGLAAPADKRVHDLWIDIAARYFTQETQRHMGFVNPVSRGIVAKAARLYIEALGVEEHMPPAVPIHEEPLETVS